MKMRLYFITLVILCCSLCSSQELKIGYVDIEYIVSNCNQKKKDIAKVNYLTYRRDKLLTALNDYHFMTVEDAIKLKEIWKNQVVESPEVNDIFQRSKKSYDIFYKLSTSKELNREDMNTLKNLVEREKSLGDLYTQWSQNFKREVQDFSESLDKELKNQIRSIIKKVGADQQFSIILSDISVSYCKFDLTQEILVKINSP